MLKRLAGVLLVVGCSENTTSIDTSESDSDPGTDADVETDSATSDTDDDPPPFTGLTIIDTHAHVVPGDEEANDAYIDALVAAAQAVGVQQIALGLHARHLPKRPPTFSTEHDDWVRAAYEKYPDMILPMLAGFDPEDEASVDYVEAELQTGIWRGIGELDLRNQPKQTTTPMNHSVLMQIYALAATFDVPVMVHFEPCYETDCDSGVAELDEAITQNPSTTFINAHSCPTDLIGNYPNFYCEYEVVIQNLPPASMYDYVVLGTDVQNLELNTPTGNRVDIPYGEVIELLRERVSTLSDEDAAKLAHGNAEAVFGL